MNTFSPNQVVPSAGLNENFTDLSTGDADVDDNSLRLFRAEAFNNFCADAAGLVWSQTSGLTGAMTAGTLYITASGIMRRFEVAAIASKAFTASKDTYVSFDADGNVDYDEETNGAAVPAPPSGYTQTAVVITDGSAITTIFTLVSRGPGEIGRTKLEFGTSDNLLISNLPYRKYIKLRLTTIGTGTLDGRLRFNGDSGNNYSYRFFHSGATTGTSTSTAGLDTDILGLSDYLADVSILNIAAKRKNISISTTEGGTTSAATAANHLLLWGKWDNASDAISSINHVNIQSGSWSAGCELVADGYN